MQTLNIAAPNNQHAGAYVNPFQQASIFNIQPPLLGELTGFDLGGDLDSSSEFMNFEDSIRKRQNMINIIDDRSEGEIGPNINLGDSVGELQPKGSKSKYKQDHRPLGQTIDYEGGLNSTSKTKDQIRQSQDNINPIYDSKEDPIPKTKKIGGNKNNVQMSGESFGNPLNRSSGHGQIQNKRGVPHRDQIAEDFLENDDDIQESGEINPDMFR